MTTSGPYQATDVSTKDAWRRRTWYRQTKPRVSRLKYELRDQRVTSRTGSSFNSLFGYSTTFQSGVALAADQAAYNAAYAKLKEAAGDSASWAVTLAERRQAVDMIVKRTTQIIAFTRSLRKGRFGEAWMALGSPESVKRPSGRHLRKKSLAGQYLEYHFGWAPLMSDIHTSCSILGREFQVTSLRGRGRAAAEAADLANQPRRRGSVTTKCQILADHRIENPNLLLWSQLGLVNPATVVWELVPFSFVVDWFVNVGEYLAHYTDFTGMTLSNVAVTYSRSIAEEAWYDPPFTVARIERKWFWLDRLPVTTVTGPSIGLRPFKRFSVRRGLAAVSLLIQILPKR